MERARNEDLDDSWSQSFNADWKSPGDAYLPECNLDTLYRSTLGFPILENSFAVQCDSNNSSTTKVTISPTKQSQSSPLLVQGLPAATASLHMMPPPQQQSIPSCKYSIKLVNPELKRDYSMHKVKSTRFETLDELRDCLSGVLPCGFTQLGYIEPGHGLKGKTQWLTGDDDLTEMYTKYGKQDVLLWCFKAVDDQQGSCQPKKRKAAGDTVSAKKPKQTASRRFAETLSEVEKLVQQLRGKHGTLYTVEQLNCWAHMYQSQKHGSLEFPPNLPYFVGTKHKKSMTSTSKDTCSFGSPSSPTCGISPSKRVTLRTECMKQLEIWHSLLEKGGITKETYDDLQHTILEDIKENF